VRDLSHLNISPQNRSASLENMLIAALSSVPVMLQWQAIGLPYNS
jgi:hypothetical protein